MSVKSNPPDATLVAASAAYEKAFEAAMTAFRVEAAEVGAVAYEKVYRDEGKVPYCGFRSTASFAILASMKSLHKIP